METPNGFIKSPFKISDMMWHMAGYNAAVQVIVDKLGIEEYRKFRELHKKLLAEHPMQEVTLEDDLWAKKKEAAQEQI